MGHRLRGIACVAALTVLAFSAAAPGDGFAWRTVNGSVCFVTGVRDQGDAGTCWAFGSTAALEAKYLITRNDPSFAMDLSEQNLVCEGSMAKKTNLAMNYLTSTGIVRELELPYTGQDTSPYWPLQPGWESRVVKSTANQNWLPADPASVKAALKAYGPLCVSIASEDLNTDTVGTESSGHAVLLVGYVDDGNYVGGGFYYIKNSWGIDWHASGYGWINYQNLSRQGNNVRAITGQAYYTGSMGTLTWTGTDGGHWST